MPIRNEHIHFSMTEAEIPKSQAWYAKTFGGKAASLARVKRLREVPDAKAAAFGRW
jgi:hypothetical protein